MLDFQSFSPEKQGGQSQVTQTSRTSGCVGLALNSGSGKGSPMDVHRGLGKGEETQTARAFLSLREQLLKNTFTLGCQDTQKVPPSEYPSPTMITRERLSSLAHPPLSLEAILLCQYCVAGLPICPLQRIIDSTNMQPANHSGMWPVHGDVSKSTALG